METPKNQRGPIRTPTPRLSERKKSLFHSKEESQEDLMFGIEPLQSKPRTTRSKTVVLKSKRSINSALISQGDDSSSSSCKSMSANSASPVSLSQSDIASTEGIHKKTVNFKENIPASVEAEQLEKLFSNSMIIGAENNDKSVGNIEVEGSAEGVHNNDYACGVKKRPIESPFSGSPSRKVQKVEKASLPTPAPFISTKNFYSSSKSPMSSKLSTALKFFHTSPKIRRNEQHRRTPRAINKGVGHKIRRRVKQGDIRPSRPKSSIDIDHILDTIGNEKLRNVIIAQRRERIQIENLHKILRNSQNPIEMARPLSFLTKQSEMLNNNNNNIEDRNKEHEPAVEEGPDFSDIECVSDDEEWLNKEEQIVTPTTQRAREEESSSPSEFYESSTAYNANRKFFKSGRSTSTRKEVKITGNIKAEVCNGKLSLVDRKKPSRRKTKAKNIGNEFSAEQATVNAILKNLDDTTLGDTSSVNTENGKTPNMEDISTTDQNEPHDSQFNDDTLYSMFRSRLPYNTSDPEIIEQQHLLLDFLISNNICTEENFTIFIADPDNHKEEAARIVDQVVVIVTEVAGRPKINLENICDLESHLSEVPLGDGIHTNRVCCETDLFENKLSPKLHKTIKQNIPQDNNTLIKASSDTFMECDTEMEIGNQNQSNRKMSQAMLSSTEESDITKSNKLFPIFYANGKCQPLSQNSSRKLSRYWVGGKGADQYQIDAGQKDFGAQQCKQCGLVYSVHEPEEEQLHRDYHASLGSLRFKGWIDEDIVAIYPQWSADGRIIRISESSLKQRTDRLKEILTIVDKELGFSSYILPKSFVAFIAVRKHIIVGLCLVQPLEKAYKYICMNGVDCCTEDEFEARCGISRIWVSPLHRRLKIASKLIEAARLHTIAGEKISLNQIAFSAPTESGKQFAKKVTKTENFLVYM